VALSVANDRAESMSDGIDDGMSAGGEQSHGDDLQ
jgi:hypothetical protein